MVQCGMQYRMPACNITIMGNGHGKNGWKATENGSSLVHDNACMTVNTRTDSHTGSLH